MAKASGITADQAVTCLAITQALAVTCCASQLGRGVPQPGRGSGERGGGVGGEGCKGQAFFIGLKAQAQAPQPGARL